MSATAGDSKTGPQQKRKRASADTTSGDGGAEEQPQKRQRTDPRSSAKSEQNEASGSRDGEEREEEEEEDSEDREEGEEVEEVEEHPARHSDLERAVERVERWVDGLTRDLSRERMLPQAGVARTHISQSSDEPAQPAQRFPYVDVRRLQYRPQRLAPSTLPTFSSPDWWKAWPGWSVLGIRNLSDAHCALEKIDQQDAVAVVFRLILRIFSPQEVIDNQAYLSSVEEREISSHNYNGQDPVLRCLVEANLNLRSAGRLTEAIAVHGLGYAWFGKDGFVEGMQAGWKERSHLWRPV
ncbi:hypothetical protein LTR66_014130 [Elasticomyces elasticus]|nr:hypothetical protein LTR66_014130 [Elasticomyces elasticus]